MKLVSPFLKKVVYPSLSGAGVFRRTGARGLAVVTYHGVIPRGYEPLDTALDGNLVRVETLQHQLRLLKSNYNLISPEDMLAWREGCRELPPRAVLLTCDDGLLNHLTDMLPILQEEAVRCLFFLTGASAAEQRSTLWYEELFLLFLQARDGNFEIACDGMVLSGELRSREQRRALWWDSVKRLSQITTDTRSRFLTALRAKLGLESLRAIDDSDSAQCRRFGLLTGAESRQLVAAGMTIGAHTLTHPILSQAPPDLAQAEIFESRARLEVSLHGRVWAFAYPFGDAQSVTPQVVEMAKEAGYTAAFLNFGGGLGADLPPHALPRIHVTADMSLAEFEAHVSGFYTLLQRGTGRSSYTRVAVQG
jgi:peptidoglycan/xylan/chitin deacetylase (PgdA/CDA1 family)